MKRAYLVIPLETFQHLYTHVIVSGHLSSQGCGASRDALCRRWTGSSPNTSPYLRVRGYVPTDWATANLSNRLTDTSIQVQSPFWGCNLITILQSSFCPKKHDKNPKCSFRNSLKQKIWHFCFKSTWLFDNHRWLFCQSTTCFKILLDFLTVSEEENSTPIV